MLINGQHRHKIDERKLRGFLRTLRRRMRLGNRQFNICIVDDKSIRGLNSRFRAKNQATDVLSFRWEEPQKDGRKARRRKSGRQESENINFLGEVVISVETAERNAAQEGHSTLNEIRWLILHGLLHLLGFDHERDHGEMTRLELKWRMALGIEDESAGKCP